MKLYVVYDQSGKIVAAVNLNSDDSDRLRPVVKKGHAAAEIEVPQEHAHLSFADVCQGLKVDTGGANPTFRSKNY